MKASTVKNKLKFIQEGDLTYMNAGKLLKKGNYRKIRSGYIQNRSPLKQRDPRLRKTTRT